MSRVFRRPMFRKGGNVGEGIMTGIRDNYENGGAAERITKAMESVPTQSFDPLTQFLIQGGLNLASQPSTGGVLSDIATAAKEPTAQLFQGLSERDKLAREIAVAGAQLDIEQDLKLQEMQQQADLKLLEQQFKAAEGDRDRQNKIAVKIQEGKNALDELQFKLENPGVDSAKAGVIPSPETRVLTLTETFAESNNPAVQQNPNLTANNLVRFQVNASPEIQSRYKGFVKYGYGKGGDPVKIQPIGQPGDIYYDPGTADFIIFDNEGNDYKLNSLTYEAEER